MIVCAVAPATLQVTVLSSSGRKSKLAIGHVPPQPPGEVQPANRPAAEAIAISAAAALDTDPTISPPPMIRRWRSATYMDRRC